MTENKVMSTLFFEKDSAKLLHNSAAGPPSVE